MRFRKSVVFLLLVILCFSLSGCGIDTINRVFENVQNIMNGIQTGALKDKVADDNRFAMSQSTKDAQQQALDAQDKAATLRDRATKVDGTLQALYPSNWFIKSRANSAEVKANDKINRYETAKATDQTFLDARSLKGIIGNVSITQWSKFGWIIAFGILILIIVIFKLLANQKRKAKAMKKSACKGNLTIVEHTSAPAPIPAPAAIQIPAEHQAALVDRNEEKAAKTCQKYCDKLGISYDEYIQKYNGDNKALLDFLISSTKEDFQ